MLFPFQPILFATDITLFIFTTIALIATKKIINNEQSKQTWKPLFKNKLYGSCFVVLTFFFGITIIDSIHFKLPIESYTNNKPIYGNNIYSLLDITLSPFGTIEEQTYSKPFASSSLNKTYVKLENGTYKSFYSPLKINKGENKNNFISILSECFTNTALLVMPTLLVLLLYGLLCTTEKSIKKRFIHSISKFKYSHYYYLIYVLLACISSLVIIATISKYYHIFGTDKVGHDVCFHSIKSIRTGMIIGTITTLFSLPLAIIFGICSGYFGKVIDDIIQYIYTTISAIPGILLISAAILSLQVWLSRNADWFNSMEASSDLRLLLICFILGITGWTSLCRLLRGETLKIRELDFITAAKTLGVGKFNILFRHILPNLMHIVLILTVIDFSGLVLAEAVLSYIGVGVDPTTISWGNMINSARLELAREPAIWWSLAAAFIFMSIMVLSANIFADGVREIFDPRGKSDKL